ncbi:MAG: phage tail protein [Anaerolineae bacterium]|nr:phage tail protein [Anaerolineae bacterium]
MSGADPALAYYFGVEIYNVLRGGYFTKVSGLGSEIEAIPHWVTSNEGQTVTSEKIPGRRTQTDIVLTRPVTENRGFWQWHEDIAKGEDKRVNCAIVAFNAEKVEVARWDVELAWPRRVTVMDMSSASTDVLLEEVTLAHSGVSRVKPAAAP